MRADERRFRPVRRNEYKEKAMFKP